MLTILRNLGVAAGVFLLTWLILHVALGVEFVLIETAHGEEFDIFINRMDGSVRRITFVYLPLIALGTGATVGVLGRNWRWAWLTALLAGGPVVCSFGALFAAIPSFLTAAHAAFGAGLVIAAATLVMRWREGPSKCDA